MKESRRDSQRISVNLEAELIYKKSVCFALIENVSANGIYVKIACMERIEDSQPNAKVDINFQIPSGSFLSLECEEKWSKKNISNSMTEQIGMEIINPSKEYTHFYNAVKSDSNVSSAT